VLYNDPMAMVGDDEAVNVELETVLDRGVAGCGDQPSCPREGRSVNPTRSPTDQLIWSLRECFLPAADENRKLVLE
jgi:hypothetical protein